MLPSTIGVIVAKVSIKVKANLHPVIPGTLWVGSRTGHVYVISTRGEAISLQSGFVHLADEVTLMVKNGTLTYSTCSIEVQNE